MSEECNGLQLAEGATVFCKKNCKWKQKKSGRPLEPDNWKRKENKNRYGQFENPRSICLVLEKEQLDFIKSKALEESMNTHRYVEANELIRRTLNQAFPMQRAQ